MKFFKANLTLLLDGVEIRISQSLSDTTVNVDYEGSVIPVHNDTVERVFSVLSGNYDKVKKYYTANLEASRTLNAAAYDLNCISLKIVIYYLRQYSSWKQQYTKSNYDIVFYDKDFDHPSTMWLILSYLNKKYPLSWKEISCGYLNKDLEEVERTWIQYMNYVNK